MRIFLVLLSVICTRAVEGGYYKIRAPPPPPVPPASLHYGPHPPLFHQHSAHSHRIYPPLPPKYHVSPHLLPHYPHSRGPHGHVQHKNMAHSREFHRVPNLAQKVLYNPWKQFNNFRAPVVRETFNPPPSSHLPTFRHEDKGPIHTIPAPNLAPADKPNLFLNQNEFLAHTQNNGKVHSSVQKKHKPEDDLVAVLQHGIQKVNVPHSTGYQVTEDPSLHQPNSDNPSYFAPDPDPSVPTVKVPGTLDPHSIPSNGQVPLDVYLQQEADKIVGQQHQTDNSNALTAQDLFNLLNYQQGSSVNLLPQAQLNQHLFQPNVEIYNPSVLLQQDYQREGIQQSAQHFTPQFQTFNYDERTQQGAYGSNSFPTASMGFQLSTGGLTTSGDLFDDFKDNEVAGSEKEEVFQKMGENEIFSRQKPKRKPVDQKQEQMEVKSQFDSTVDHIQSFTPYKSTPILVTKTPTFDVQTTKSEKRQGEKPTNESLKHQTKSSNTETTRNVVIKPEENIQLQKSIQTYENTKRLNLSKDEASKKNQKDGKTGRGLFMEEMVPETIYKQADVGSVNIPFGVRLRPKRN